ncbi:hypothetical protein [Brevibacillus parabrevis]|uniref:hypothetical protein n=1 Tax=Brevibacillus parabrevis TaxID=54914 RepID=UPI0028D41D13|nr:hypothetical protein [Brevibacillus parabrevis]
MALLNKPLKLLEVIWSGHFDTIFIYVDGTWSINEKKKEEVCSLCKEELIASSKLEALNQLMILNTKLLEATTEEYAKLAKEDYDFQYAQWEYEEQGSKDCAEDRGEEYIERPFKYKPFSSVEERIQSYYHEIFVDYMDDLSKQLSDYNNQNIQYEFEELESILNYQSSIFHIPFGEKVAFYVSDGKKLRYIDENHSLYPILKNEVSRVAKLAINDARKSVKEDLHEWFISQFGYELK